MRWILTALITSVIGIVILAACEGNVFSLKVGDCYNGPHLDTMEITEVRDVELVSCEEPHESEVYAIFELPDSGWKNEDYVSGQADIGCEARFEAFVGIGFAFSTLYYDFIFPLEESWRDGDRLVQCSVVEENYAKVTGSLKGSRR